MTKKSLMIASAIILPLTVGVMAMGIGAGNKFNDHLVAGTASDVIDGSVDFIHSGAATESSSGSRKWYTKGTTARGTDLFLVNSLNSSATPSSDTLAFFPSTYETGASALDSILFGTNESASSQFRFQKVTSITLKAHRGVSVKVEISNDGSFFIENKVIALTANTSITTSLNIADKYLRVRLVDGPVAQSINILELSLGFRCSPSGHMDDPKELASISVSPTITEFTVGDTFEFGGSVVATYDDTSTQDVTGLAVFSGYDMNSAGDQTVTVTYTENAVEKTTTYAITVLSASGYIIEAGSYCIANSVQFTLNNDGTGNYNWNNYNNYVDFTWEVDNNVITFTRTSDFYGEINDTKNTLFKDSSFETIDVQSAEVLNNNQFKIRLYKKFGSVTGTNFTVSKA